MKQLQNLKNRLFKSKFTSEKENQKVDSPKAKTLITRAFSKDEDTFMFI